MSGACKAWSANGTDFHFNKELGLRELCKKAFLPPLTLCPPHIEHLRPRHDVVIIIRTMHDEARPFVLALDVVFSMNSRAAASDRMVLVTKLPSSRTTSMRTPIFSKRIQYRGSASSPPMTHERVPQLVSLHSLVAGHAVQRFEQQKPCHTPRIQSPT